MNNSEHEKFTICLTNETYIEGLNLAIDKVARERKYLAFLIGPSLESSRSFVLEILKENWPHFVAIINGKVVGWCNISSLHRPVYQHAGTLGIGVVDRYRGLGIGHALMSAALQKAKEQGLTRIELTVREHNTRAISLYKKFGFVVEGFHKNAIRIDGQYENQISMGLIFD